MARMLVFALCVLGIGCAGTVESSLRASASHGTVPTDLQVTFDDHSDLLGGDRIEVHPDGVLRWWRVRPGFVSASAAPEEHLEGSVELPRAPATSPTIEARVTPEDLLRLVDLLLAIEPWNQRAETGGVRVDQRRAVLEVSVGHERERCWDWADDSGEQVGLSQIRTWAEEALAPILGAATAAPAITPVQDDTTPEQLELPAPPPPEAPAPH